MTEEINALYVQIEAKADELKGKLTSSEFLVKTREITALINQQNQLFKQKIEILNDGI